MKNISIILKNGYDPCFFWALQNCSYEIDSQNNTILLKYKNNCIFLEIPKANNREYIPDKKIEFLSFSNDLLKNYKIYKQENKTDTLILGLTNGESVESYCTNQQELINWMVEFLNDNNYLLLTTTDYNIPFSHENIFYHPFLNIVKWYYYLGYRYLNFYSQQKKDHLLGIYHGNRKEEYGSEWRNRISNNLTNILNDDYYIYTKPSIAMEEIVDSIKWTNNLVWDKNHSTSYLDYNQSAMNLIWESEHEKGRPRITEKTLKAILFSKAGIFFMWYGSETMYKVLVDNGFWFLNFDFYDVNQPINPLENSVYKVAEYLKELKIKYGTDTEVYNFLLDQYGSKLESNFNKLQNLIKNSPFEKKFLDAIIL